MSQQKVRQTDSTTQLADVQGASEEVAQEDPASGVHDPLLASHLQAFLPQTRDEVEDPAGRVPEGLSADAVLDGWQPEVEERPPEDPPEDDDEPEEDDDGPEAFGLPPLEG